MRACHQRRWTRSKRTERGRGWATRSRRRRCWRRTARAGRRSGRNAHVILEEAPPPEVERGGEPEADVVALVVSGRSEVALREQASRLRAHLEHHPEQGMAAVARTLAQGRARLEHRGVVVGTEREELLAGLGALAKGEERPGVLEGAGGLRGKVGLVFPGQGGQWLGMGRGLWESSSAFREEVEACGEALGWDLGAVLRGEAEMEGVEVVQPALWGLMVSLGRLWLRSGLEVSGMLGQSQGEIAAACV